ncbi:hypothetical protein [Pseudomonas capsici]|uniref:Lipoprotein n=1 Tax=Pseudomonas capsici TaxID=2810614 RepID=A0ABT3BUQ7_9PSED|nr:hypothetical protein [Pseudomonas capsici]MBN6714332.1 hypothetical protein [Pseudomonas capsici]MBN6719721.1 hypothetical protein [Pseudomonas capsici]MBN6723939.1 hypothetical protein [Pseudomonas capsici]MCV4266071.1 hypothetical protein [Pseudomonas capsici]MCV4277324.1 hypothetical protein [Pseudomonas capsici]
MQKTIPCLILLSFALAACGPNELVSSLPSPDGKHHVEVRRCPESGSITWGEKLQVSVLDAGVSAACQSAVEPWAQFDITTPEPPKLDLLQLEWASDTQLRAWYPGFKPVEGPRTWTYKRNTPVKVIFQP